MSLFPSIFRTASLAACQTFPDHHGLSKRPAPTTHRLGAIIQKYRHLICTLFESLKRGVLLKSRKLTRK